MSSSSSAVSRRTGAAAGLLAVLLAACGTQPAPVPEGYSFPTWHTPDGGASALLEGPLAERGGCLYVRAPAPSTTDYLVVWPDTLHLEIRDGVATVTNGAVFSVRVGERVSLGGGEITDSLVPETAAACDTSHVWGTSEIVGLPR